MSGQDGGSGKCVQVHCEQTVRGRVRPCRHLPQPRVPGVEQQVGAERVPPLHHEPKLRLHARHQRQQQEHRGVQQGALPVRRRRRRRRPPVPVSRRRRGGVVGMPGVVVVMRKLLGMVPTRSYQGLARNCSRHVIGCYV